MKSTDVVAAVVIGLFVCGFLGWTIHLLKNTSKDELRDEEFKSKYGNLTIGVAVDRYWSRFYISAFLLRRILFSMIPAVFADL